MWPIVGVSYSTDLNHSSPEEISGNKRRVFDLEVAKKNLGYMPQDDAEDYFRCVED